jgi:hypothetical protein
MLVTAVSFFNEVATDTKNYPHVVSFFNKLEIKKLCSKTIVSFFNEVSSETQKLSSEVLSLIMDSKRTMLQNGTMSRVATGVKRSSSNNPIEEITMPTNGSKSLEVEAIGDNAT